MGGGLPAGFGDIADTDMIWAGCIAAIPAVAVLYAFGARVGGAPALVRWIWLHGRALVAMSVLIHVAVAVAQHGFDPRSWLGATVAVKVVVLADLAIVSYVFLSSRVRQALLDFPSA